MWVREILFKLRNWRIEGWFIGLLGVFGMVFKFYCVIGYLFVERRNLYLVGFIGWGYEGCEGEKRRCVE